MAMRRLLAVSVVAVLGFSAVCAPAPVRGAGFFEGVQPNTLQPRRALVIAVPTVRHAAGFLPLKNPVNDAAAVTRALDEIGFRFTQNLTARFEAAEMTRRTIKTAIYDFAAELKGTDTIGLIYFAGHGIERDDGRRYLVPYDALVRYERDLADELIPVELIYDAFREADNPLNFLILDTCRDNPYAETLGRFAGGPARPDARKRPANVVILSSTLKGDVAADGVGDLSPFAQAFIDGTRAWDRHHAVVLDAISGRIERYQGPGNAAYQIGELVTRGAGGFVFAPSKQSFDTEKADWERLAARQRVSISEYREHQFQHRGGYFHDAAANAIHALERGPRPIQHGGLGLPPSFAGKLTALNPGWRVRDAPGGVTVAFTPNETVATLPAAPPVDAAAQDTTHAWWPVNTNAGIKYIAAGAFKNLPSADRYVTVPVEQGVSFKKVAAPAPGVAASFQPIRLDSADPKTLKIETFAPPLAKITIPADDPDDPAARARAWRRYLDKALEMERAGLDLSQASLEFVRRDPDAPGDAAVAELGYWADPVTLWAADHYRGPVPVAEALFRNQIVQ